MKAALRRLYYRNRVILVKRDAHTPVPEARAGNDLEFKRVDRQNIGDTAVFESAAYKEIYTQMLEERQHGFFGYLNGVCVYRRWVKECDHVIFDGIYTMRLSAVGALFHYDFCAPSVRGKGIHTEDICRLCKQFNTLDCYAMIAPDNSASMVGYLRCGFYKYLDVTVGYFLLIPYHIVREIPAEEKYTINGAPVNARH